MRLSALIGELYSQVWIAANVPDYGYSGKSLRNLIAVFLESESGLRHHALFMS